MIILPTACPLAVTSKKHLVPPDMLSLRRWMCKIYPDFDSKNEENLTDAELLKAEEKRE